MASYTYTTTAMEEAGITADVAILNAASPQTPWTNASWVADRLSAKLQNNWNSRLPAITARCVTAFGSASTANQNLALSTLGLTGLLSLGAGPRSLIINNLLPSLLGSASTADQTTVLNALGITA